MKKKMSLVKLSQNDLSVTKAGISKKKCCKSFGADAVAAGDCGEWCLGADILCPCGKCQAKCAGTAAAQ